MPGSPDSIALVIKVPLELRERIIAATLSKFNISVGSEDQNLTALEEIVRNHYLYQVLFDVESKQIAERATEAYKEELLGVIQTSTPPPAPRPTPPPLVPPSPTAAATNGTS